jgi:basic amino acid/polyamine antiporter, APA family
MIQSIGAISEHQQLMLCITRSGFLKKLDLKSLAGHSPTSMQNQSSVTGSDGVGSRLSRSLGTFDATMIGLGAMIGAGIFAAIGPAVHAAGSGLIPALALAAGLAYLNAITMAQLAALDPESGATYTYGRKRLGPVWGYLAGWGFVIGKIASCTAMALTFANYAFPQFAHLAAPGLVITLTLINYLGVKKTATVTQAIVVFVIATLLTVVGAVLFGGSLESARLTGWTDQGGVPGILQAAGMMFFAFAGYARIATLGEEVKEPHTTIPRAILFALAVTVALYAIVVLTTLLALPVDTLAGSTTPLADALLTTRFASLSPLVRLGAAVASAGVLLSLLAGVSRTVFAMSANRDLPEWLAAVHVKNRVPHRAELAIGVIVAVVVSFADLRTAIGFSSFAILTYYAIANAAAWTLKPTQRLVPRWMSAAGLLACVAVATSLPAASVLSGLALFVVGLAIYGIQHARRKSRN